MARTNLSSPVQRPLPRAPPKVKPVGRTVSAPEDGFDSALLDPSIFTSRRSFDWAKGWIGRTSRPLQVCVPGTFVTFLRTRRSARRRSPPWETWSHHRPGPSIETVASFLETCLDRKELAPYSVPRAANPPGAFQEFRQRLPPGRAPEEITARVLFEERSYLRARCVVLTEYWWPFDALVEAGSISTWAPERHLPPHVVSAVRKWGLRGMVRYMAIGLGRVRDQTVVPFLLPFSRSDEGALFLGLYPARID